MRYLLLLYDDATLTDRLSVDELRRIYGEHLAFVDRLRDDGTYVMSAHSTPPGPARSDAVGTASCSPMPRSPRHVKSSAAST